MRYGSIPDDSFEEQLLASSAAPLALFDSFIPLVQASTLMAAVRIDLFERLRKRPRNAVELADELEVDADTLQLVLRVLVASNYLAGVGDGRFELTDVARQTLLSDSDNRLTAWVSMCAMFWDRFSEMGEVLRSGRGIDMHHQFRGPTDWRTYQAAMLENARRMAPLVAAMVPVSPGATKLLDIAGSHGLYGALISRAHPPMRAEVLDLPDAVAHARELADAEGITNVVSFRTGDALVDDLGTGHDVVFLGNILHHFSAAQSGALLARIKSAMNPGGTVAIWDVRQPDADDVTPDVIGDTFALFFRLTSTARCYTTGEFIAWLSDAGFVDPQVQALPVGRSLQLVTGRAP
jgi:hypothetical protein